MDHLHTTYYSPHGLHDGVGHSTTAPLGEMWHGEMWQNMATSSQPSSSTPDTLSQADIDFVNNVLVDPYDEQQVAEDVVEPDVNTARASSASSKKVPRQRKVPSKSSNTPKLSPEERLELHRKQVHTRRETLKWPEPKTLQDMDHLLPIPQPATIVYRTDQTLIENIRRKLFGNDLQWVQNGDLAGQSMSLLYKKSPMHTYSRRLPLIDATDLDGSELNIHITQHGFKDVRLETHDLKGKIWHLVWGIPRKLNRVNNSIILYGAAYIEPKDNAAVDKHLTQALREAGLAVRTHV
ncbi:conserved hypothetical Ustilaginaceae-specific protein [Sporisorium reilianum SRZ2]|uniref:Conserved hypothetical Ustilaginaceae-specific protein n=1 Tax=Sporisorium reilianum (strain SRZ2) TaxID=999809 RepID=E6ZZM3_SPORE|nr:conserved hypothetical Ustilaginaceae-specific protein [Sporisorium reilianum SRZ2]